MTPPESAAIPAALPGSPADTLAQGVRPRGFREKFRKYAKIFRVTLVERMTYRTDFFVTTFLRFLPILTTVLLWQAIYSGVGAASGQTTRQAVMSGFSFDDMIAYLLLVNISRMFSSMPGLAGGISSDIRQGTLKKYLIQPIDMIHYLVSYRIAHKVTYVISSALPYAVLFFICRGFFAGRVPTDATTWLAYAASLVMAFLVGFYFETCVGMVGFWFLEVTSILWIVMTLNFFISGHMLPLDLLPKFWADLLKDLPFQYMAYFPAVVFLQKITGWGLAVGLLKQAVWSAFFIVLARILYRRGLRRYSAFGG
jgi:ABC-2 type transport system permease protein